MSCRSLCSGGQRCSSSNSTSQVQTGIGLWVIIMVPGIVLHIFNPSTQEAETGERQRHVNLCVWGKPGCLRISISAQTSWPRSMLGRKGFIQLTPCTLLLITKGSEDWNSSRWGCRRWCWGHGEMYLTGLLPLACSACSCIEPKTNSPGMAPPTRGPTHLVH